MRMMGMLLLVPLGACAPSLQVYTHADRDASLEGLHSFAIGSAEAAPSGYRRGSVAAEVTRLVDDSATGVLTAKGYVTAPVDSADLVVRVGVGQRQKVEAPIQQQDSTGDQVAIADLDGPFIYTEQELVIDVFNGKTSRRVWHGAARGLIEPGNIDRAAIKQAVERMLASFPH